MTRAIVRDAVRCHRVVIIGGGCYGSWYTQQLARAAERGAFIANEVIVVDRDAACRVAREQRDGAFSALPLRVVTDTWDDYLAAWMSEGRDAVANDTMVPSPLMPHLCLDWLVSRAKLRSPGRAVLVAPLTVPPPMPWQRASPDGRHYVSFATWTCPVNCIEPARCPATRGPRDWSMPRAIADYVAQQVETAPGDVPTLRGPVIFHCTHRTYGVGMIDASVLAAADEQLARWVSDLPVSVLVGTVSHCHGALGVLQIV